MWLTADIAGGGAVVMHVAFVAPLSPNPSRPAGRKGSSTTIFGGLAPTTALHPNRCHHRLTPAFLGDGRSQRLRNQGAHSKRAAACRVPQTSLAFTTTAGSPTCASKGVTQLSFGKAFTGVQPPNLAVELPFRPAGREGLGESGDKTETAETGAQT